MKGPQVKTSSRGVCLLILLAILESLGCAGSVGMPHSLLASEEDSLLSMKWFRTKAAVKPRGVALVIHGLNLNPDRMTDVIHVLNVSGIDCLGLSLRGHGDNFRRRDGLDAVESRMEDFKGVSHALWSQEALAAYEEAHKTASANSIPLFLVGFSYGGLIGLDLLVSRPGLSFDQALLFAPALSLHGWEYAVRLFASFPKLVLPTFSPAPYPANPGTPIAAYNALFETLDHFETRIGPQINIPTLVIIDLGDELVSFKGLKQMAEEYRLDRWRFFPIRRSQPLPHRMLCHIIIDEASVGRETWTEIRKEMIAHLLKDPN
jgi:pimeloyl-ACP methyl ester carboxylesterase